MGLRRRNREPGVVIDLREPEAAPALWGSPIPCPSCAGRGYLDHIDPFREIMFLHCTRCEARYEVAKAELEGASS